MKQKMNRKKKTWSHIEEYKRVTVECRPKKKLLIWLDSPTDNENFASMLAMPRTTMPHFCNFTFARAAAQVAKAAQTWKSVKSSSRLGDLVCCSAASASSSTPSVWTTITFLNEKKSNYKKCRQRTWRYRCKLSLVMIVMGSLGW